MANCRAGLNLELCVLDLNNREAVVEKLIDILSIDADLSENEDYFSDDTLELGYENEAERIVAESTKRKKFDTPKRFEKVFGYVFSALSNQEYWGECEYRVEDLGDNKIALAYAIGGADMI